MREAQADIDGTTAYSSNNLNLQMPAPFNSHLEPEASYAGQMLTGSFTNYYAIGKTIKVENPPGSAARVDIVDQSESTISSSPVSGGDAVLDVGKHHFPLGAAIIVYDSSNSSVVSSPARIHGGDCLFVQIECNLVPKHSNFNFV